MASSEQIKAGDRVQERYAPTGCQPYVGTALYVAKDGWIDVEIGGRSISVAPHEIERVSDDPADELAAMRGWIAECDWADAVDDLTDAEVRQGIQHYYGGGIAGFRRDAAILAPKAPEAHAAHSGPMYAISVVLEVSVPDDKTAGLAWSTSIQIPTFYLLANVQGIVDERHAERIAAGMFERTENLITAHVHAVATSAHCGR